MFYGGETTSREDPIFPVGEDRPDVCEGRPNSVLFPLCQGFNLGENIPELELAVHVINVGQDIQSRHESTDQLRCALGGCNRPVQWQIEETLDGEGREYETLVLVPHQNHIGDGLPRLFKPLEIQQALPQRVANGDTGLEVQVVFRFQKKSHRTPNRIPIGAVRGRYRSLRAFLVKLLTVGILDIFFDTGVLESFLHDGPIH